MSRFTPDAFVSTPVDIKTFITDPQYLGDFLCGGLYPYWQDKLQETYEEDMTSPISEVVIAGSLGSGKTYAAVVGFLYDLYVLTLVKDPHSFLKIIPGMPLDMVIAVPGGGHSNICDLVRDAIWLSPYFASILLTKNRDALEEGMFPNNIGFLPIEHRTDILGRGVIGCIFEDSVYDTVEDKRRMSDIYYMCRRRMIARFMTQDGSVPCKFWTVTSASNSTESFLWRNFEEYRAVDSVKVIEPSIWQAQAHKGIYCGETFTVFIGDGYDAPRILKEGEIGDDNLHGRVIRVPVEYLDDFQKNIYSALPDLAGVPVIKPELPEIVPDWKARLVSFFGNDSKFNRSFLYVFGVILVFILGVLYGMYGIKL